MSHACGSGVPVPCEYVSPGGGGRQEGAASAPCLCRVLGSFWELLTVLISGLGSYWGILGGKGDPGRKLWPDLLFPQKPKHKESTMWRWLSDGLFFPLQCRSAPAERGRLSPGSCVTPLAHSLSGKGFQQRVVVTGRSRVVCLKWPLLPSPLSRPQSVS